MQYIVAYLISPIELGLISSMFDNIRLTRIHLMTFMQLAMNISSGFSLLLDQIN